MSEVSQASIMQNHIKQIIRMDCKSLPAKAEPAKQDFYAATPSRKASRARIASLSTIRALLVSYSELSSELQGIVKITDLKQYAAFRQPLSQRVLPDSLFAFEYCQQVMGLKGAVDTPVAAKLATVAHQICDFIDLIKSRINIALEYHDSKINVFGEIREFISSPDLDETRLDPLFFSLETILPSRIDSFAASALPSFPKQVIMSKKIHKDLLALAKSRAKELKSDHGSERYPSELATSALINSPLSKITRESQSPKVNKPSPYRTKIPLLRGFKHRQQLSGNHKRIVSLSGTEKSFSDSPTESSQDPLSDTETPLQGESQFGEKKRSAIYKDDASTSNTSSSIRPPTRIENRRVSGPTWDILYGQTSAEPKETVISTHHPRPLTAVSNSQIPRPTELKPRRNSHIPTISCDFNCAEHLFNTSFDTCDDSNMMSSSPENSFAAETPLTHRNSFQQRSRASMFDLNAPRRRVSSFR